MCRNIKRLYNFEPPATEAEIEASALQFVRKLSGMAKPSEANREPFERAVQDVCAVMRRLLLEELVTTATPRSREEEAARAQERGRKREAQMRARYGG